MLLSVLISSLFLLINAPNAATQNVSKTVTFLITSSDDLYRRFIRTVYSKNLNKFDFFENEKGTYYVLRPDQPLEFEKTKYYFNESHEDLKEFNEICEYRINYLGDAKELTKTYFPDGSSLDSIYYHCSFPYDCLGLECVVEKRFVLAVIFIIILVLCFFMIRKCVIKEIKQMEKIRNQCTRPQYIPGPRFMSPLSLNVEVQEPPPPSYNMVVSMSPPSYESVMRDEVTYTLPSQIPIA